MKAIFAVLVFAICAAFAAGKSCEALGFSSLVVCSDCGQLESFVSDAALVAECRRCCTPDAEGAAGRFAQATLEVCPHTIPSLPHLADFIKQKAKGYKALTVRYVPGVQPRLVMRRGAAAGGATQPTLVPIRQWKGDDVEAYLREKLETAGGAEA